jgi:hypothetical protein
MRFQVTVRQGDHDSYDDEKGDRDVHKKRPLVSPLPADPKARPFRAEVKRDHETSLSPTLGFKSFDSSGWCRRDRVATAKAGVIRSGQGECDDEIGKEHDSPPVFIAG